MAKVIMTSAQLVQRLETLAARRTFYKNKYPYNLCYINSDGRTSADCSNLYKALLNGYDVNVTTVGYYQRDLSNTGDCTEYGLISQCSGVTGDFTKLQEGVVSLLYMSGHIGGYIGKTVNRNGKLYNVIECTPSFGGGIVYSWVDSDGTRRQYKNGGKNGRWTKNGLMTPWVDYSGTIPTPDPSTLPVLKQGSSGQAVVYLQELLIANGYDPNGVDGYFGPGCDKAVRAFQKDHGLVVDGCVGPATWTALINGASNKTTVQKPVEAPKPATPTTPAPAPVEQKKEENYPTLKQGDSGEYVKKLQQLLVDKGYNPNGVDGQFGPGCAKAVKKFQKDNGLTADGVVGPKTWAALLNTNTVAPAPVQQTATPKKKDISKYPVIQKGSTGKYVTELQTLLTNKGYNPGGIDGQFGPNCEKAVKKYQKDKKLTADGVVGPKTWDSLING